MKIKIVIEEKDNDLFLTEVESIEHPFRMLSHVFYRLGRLCASHPWEIIIAFLTLIVWRGSLGNNTKICGYDCSEENKGVELVLLSIARCVAILFFIHPFLKLNKLGSTFLVVIGGVFTFSCLVSCFVFSINMTNLLAGDFTELNKALPFYFLLMDITNAGLLAQFALSSSTQEEVQENIAQGMSIIGPTITLDTIVKTLVIGVGTLSGVRRLEELCRFACMSAVINYFMFLLFFPACLALILELSRDQDEGRPVWYFSTLSRILQQEEEQKPNPVLQRVKLIMSAGLVLVHAHSRYPVFIASRHLQQANKSTLENFPDQPSNWDLYMQKFGSAEQMVLVTLACTFAIIYHYFISHEDLSEHLAAANSSPSRRPLSYRTFTSQTSTYEGSLRSHDVIQESATQITRSKPNPVSFTVGERSYDCKKVIKTLDESVQTEMENTCSVQESEELPKELRSIEECKEILKSQVGGAGLFDDEVVMLAERKIIPVHALETVLRNPKRGVLLRRKLISKLAKQEDVFDSLPYSNYDYRKVMGSCCENVIGYVPIPVGIAGPLLLDEELLYIPMATTEGCLVASTNRGCRALTMSGGVRSSLLSDGMTRAPAIRLPTEREAGKIKLWVEERENFEVLKAAFDSTSRFARLQSIEVQTAGRLAYLRFKATTGDAMGMNMLSKGVDEALNKLCDIFPEVRVLSISGNYCTDKKPAAVNWIRGRGKEVVCGAQIPAKVVKEVLKTNVRSLINLNITKNYIGSAMAGSVGGFNAQAANIVTAIYLATGQDPAQNVTSSNCITQLEFAGPDEKDLYISCTMPSIEVGTVGGGTFLPAQSSCLELLGVKGSCDESPGRNAAKLARIVCATVLAGELSLLAALAEGHLVRSHMTHNRSSVNVLSTSPKTLLENKPSMGIQAT
ncbi:3-hydroxy-3-methylglutaryl-coenzyme A reductase [Caerostris darwini]|uniref:3-hydroxy-3-methylglutaryl coenzyme A reductase n=1 Tax=Caerostris darwini TaxID=1538125 RepID=A0AAV4W0V3_9ARAC|nr:3-hydroxy-3-methylglutaryl-coenzyme A reductase [Caerostris darwini]